MKISVCVTVYNENPNIVFLINSLQQGNLVPNEIIIVDAGSTDGTIEKIKMFRNVKLIISKGTSIAQGRNLAVRASKNSVIAMTDAGCICNQNWLTEITRPFLDSTTNVVAGFYKMVGNSNFQKALKPFLGIVPSKFSERDFLPSARSMAFRRFVWSEIGGFSEKFERAGEDTDFNRKIISQGFHIVRVKKAVVKWEVPRDLITSLKKFFFYSRGDAQSGNYLTLHNLKVITIFARYVLFISLLFLSILNNSFTTVFVFTFGLYLIWSVYKHHRFVKRWKGRFYTAIIQIASDFAVMTGFLTGVWDILNK